MTISRKNSKNRSRNLKKTAKRFAAYSAAAAATVAAQGRSANAEEIVYDIPDVAISGLGIQFNIISGATAAATVSFSNYVEGSFRVGSAFFAGDLELAGPAFSYAVGFVGPGGFVSAYFYASILSAGDTVGPAASFSARVDSPSYGNYAFLSDFDRRKGFAGLRFDINGSTHYGWAEISGVGVPLWLEGGGQTLHGFGYNDQAGVASVTPTVTTADVVFADLDSDKDVDAADWVIFRDNNQSDLSMLTPEEAYLLGDLDADLDNDIDDFDLFRNAYEEANPGQALGSSVPEPSAMILLASGAAGLGSWRRRRAGKSA